MKYYVVEIAEGDSSIAGKGVYTYEDRLAALSSYHKKLGTAMGSPLYKSDLLVVVREDGLIEATDMHVAPVTVEDTPTETEAENA